MTKYVCDFNEVRNKLQEIQSNSDFLDTLMNNSALEELTSNNDWESKAKESFDEKMIEKTNKLINDILELKNFIEYVQNATDAIEDNEISLSKWQL